MFETVVVATDGSESTRRGIRTALDLADRFDASVHALYVLDSGDVHASPESVRETLEEALRTAGEDALAFVREQAENLDTDVDVVTAVREGRPENKIVAYACDVDADVIAMGTRGRHGEHAFLLGSVAEAVVRRAPMPVLTVRQLDDREE